MATTETPVAARSPLVTAVLAAAGAGMVAAGVWCLASPSGFAAWAGFPANRHFVHDAGAFQIGIGATLLLAVVWADAQATALAGFLVGNTLHVLNHAADLDVGGHALDAWGLGLVSLLVAVALRQRLRHLGYIVGQVSDASEPTLGRFLRQKTVRLTSYRRDGTVVGAPVSIVVDGDRAFVRSPGKGGKVKRMRHNPTVEIEPCTGRGRPTGPPLRMHARLLDPGSDEYRTARRLLARKYPLLQGTVVPLLHRIGRSKFGHTVHFELIPSPGPAGNPG